MNRFVFRHFVLLFAIVAVSARSSEAQSAVSCNNAVAVATNSALPPVGSPDWAQWNLVASCGRIDVFVGALSQTQIMSEADVERAGALFRLYDGRLDGILFAAYANVVSNGGASDAFRVAAMRALGELVQPDIDIRLPSTGSTRQGCGVTAVTHVDDPTPSTLPADARSQATITFAAVAGTNASTRVKLAAKCWQDLLERNTPLDLTKVSIAYVCGNRFKVSNGNPAGIDLNFRTVINAGVGEFGVRGKGDYTLTVDTTGTLEVYLSSTLVGTAANGGTTCN